MNNALLTTPCFHNSATSFRKFSRICVGTALSAKPTSTLRCVRCASRSSKLIHGGLRYLEQGEIALVREAATERKVLRRIAPHLTETAPMFVPVYGRTSAGVYKLRVGLALRH